MVIKIAIEMLRYDSEMNIITTTREEADIQARKMLAGMKYFEGPIQDDTQFIYRAIKE